MKFDLIIIELSLYKEGTLTVTVRSYCFIDTEYNNYINPLIDRFLDFCGGRLMACNVYEKLLLFLLLTGSFIKYYCEILSISVIFVFICMPDLKKQDESFL